MTGCPLDSTEPPIRAAATGTAAYLSDGCWKPVADIYCTVRKAIQTIQTVSSLVVLSPMHHPAELLNRRYVFAMDNEERVVMSVEYLCSKGQRKKTRNASGGRFGGGGAVAERKILQGLSLYDLATGNKGGEEGSQADEQRTQQTLQLKNGWEVGGQKRVVAGAVEEATFKLPICCWAGPLLAIMWTCSCSPLFRGRGKGCRIVRCRQ
jgi:hypothetical protein